MSETIIVARDEQVGDALMSLPAIHQLAWELAQERIIYLAMTNRDVAEMMEWPVNVRDILRCEPPFGLGTPGGPTPYADADVIVLGVAAAIQYDHRNALHPTQCVMGWAGLDVPDEVPRPKLNVPDMDVPAYDYIVAPWSRDSSRSMSRQKFDMLIEHIHTGSSVAILGGADDWWPAWLDRFGVVQEYGKRWAYVVNLMRKCKRAVITVDSAPGRLAHAVGIPNHILLASSVTPLKWQTYPGCHPLYAAPNQWRVREILTTIEFLEAQSRT